jgi:predicted transcriptional regulator
MSGRPKLTASLPKENSVKPDYVTCLEDAKKFKNLERHLKSLDMTPNQYRAKWGLRHDCPMVAPAYAAKRSELAKSMGLGNLRQKAEAAKAHATKGSTAKGSSRRKSKAAKAAKG